MIILILFTAFAASGQLEATEAVKEGNFRETRIDSWYIPTPYMYIPTYNIVLSNALSFYVLVLDTYK